MQAAILDKSAAAVRQRGFDGRFLPDALSRVHELPFLGPAQASLLSQIQGRTYAGVFALVARLADAGALGICTRLCAANQLFRWLERMAALGAPAGYDFRLQPHDVAGALRGKSAWALLGLALHAGLSAQAHCRSGMGDAGLSQPWKDVFLLRWEEDAPLAALGAAAWRRENARLGDAQRDSAVDDLVALLEAADGLLRMQARADAQYFLDCAGPAYSPDQKATVHDLLLKAYRRQYIVAGVHDLRFTDVLTELVTPAQLERLGTALAPILEHAGD